MDNNTEEMNMKEQTQQTNSTNPIQPTQQNTPTIIIFTTGGTIAGVGSDERPGMATAYTSGALEGEKVVSLAEGINKLAKIETVSVCNINSDDVTFDIMATLAQKINEMSKRPEVKGFVITHGTDTMEETAYFLSLTVKTDKPVVLTGAMRPSTSIGFDGAMNLYQAVTVALDQQSVGRGVMVVMSNRIYSARFVSKKHTCSLEAFGSLENGCMGAVLDENVEFYYHIDKKHTVNSEFDLQTISHRYKDIRIDIIYFVHETNRQLLETSLKEADGVVIVGAGMGEYSLEFKSLLEKAKIPVVITSRNGEGIIPKNALLCDSTVAASNMPASKVAILLKLAMSSMNVSENGSARRELQRVFEQY